MKNDSSCIADSTKKEKTPSLRVVLAAARVHPQSLISNLLEFTILRYIVIACLAYAIDIGVFSLLRFDNVLDISSSNIVGKIATALFGFFGHRSYTFRLTCFKSIGIEALKYFSLAALYVPFTTGLLLLFLPFAPNETIAKIVADILGVILSFALAKFFVFRKSHAQ